LSTSAEQTSGSELRFRDTVRHLPLTVWIISLGILVNRIGNFLPVFIVFYLTSKNFSPTAAGLVLGAAGLGNVLGSAIGGYLADRLGRRWTIVLSMIATAGFTAGIPLFDALPVLVALVGLAGTAGQVYRPAAAALLMDATTTTQQRLAAFAVHRLAMNIGAAIGGVVGGVLATVSYVGLFLGNAIACLLLASIAAGLLRDVVRVGSDADQEHSPGSTEPEPSYRQALADRRLQRFLVMTLIAEFIYIQSTVGLPLHVDGIGLSPTSFGLLMGLNGLLVALFELPITGAVSRRRPGLVLAVGNVFTGVGLALTGVANNMFWLAATVLLWTLGEMLYSSMANAYLGGLAPPTMGGRYQGLYGATVMLGGGVGPMIGGAVYAYNEWALWAICAVGGIWSAQLCLPPLLSRPSPAAVPLSEPVNEPVNSGSPQSGGQTEPRPERRCRIILRPAAAGTPVVNLVHPASGSVACYRRLASELSPEVATVAFLAPSLDGGVLDGDVESMADRYLTELPPGPVLLGGWSLGGIIAFEMARRLAAAGRDTGPLLLIDTPLPGSGAVDDAALMAEFDYELHRMIRGAEITAEERATRFEIFRAHVRAQVAYRPPSPVRNDLMVLSRRHNEDAHRWQTHTTGRLRLRRLPADHYELMEAPHAGAIARLVKTMLIG